MGCLCYFDFAANFAVFVIFSLSVSGNWLKEAGTSCNVTTGLWFIYLNMSAFIRKFFGSR